jgi:hypothetical protein
MHFCQPPGAFEKQRAIRAEIRSSARIAERRTAVRRQSVLRQERIGTLFVN